MLCAGGGGQRRDTLFTDVPAAPLCGLFMLNRCWLVVRRKAQGLGNTRAFMSGLVLKDEAEAGH